MEFLSNIFANSVWMLVIGFVLSSAIYVMLRKDWRDTISMLREKIDRVEDERDRVMGTVGERVEKARKEGADAIGVLIVAIERSAKTGRFFYTVNHPGDEVESVKPGTTVFVSSNRHFKTQYDALSFVQNYLDHRGLRYAIQVYDPTDVEVRDMVDLHQGVITNV